MAKRPIKLCKEESCQDEQTTIGYCRLHYLKNWKKIREKQKKKAIVNLNKYVEHIMKKNPDSYVDAIKQELRDSGRFQRKADEFFATEEFRDVMDEVDMDEEVDRIIDCLKVDTSL